MLRVGLGGISGTNILSIGRGVSVGGGGGVQPAPCEPVDQIDGNVPDDATFMHPADGVVAIDIDTHPGGVASSNQLRIVVRSQDANNQWHVQLDSTQAVRLFERVGGSLTQRASAAGGDASGQRLAIVLSGTTIAAYLDTVQLWSYSDAINFTAATSGYIRHLGDTGAAISDLKTWTLACRTMEGV